MRALMRLIKALINKYFYVNTQGVDEMRANSDIMQPNTTGTNIMGSRTFTEIKLLFNCLATLWVILSSSDSYD